jgi:hypothetical protein
MGHDPLEIKYFKPISFEKLVGFFIGLSAVDV